MAGSNRGWVSCSKGHPCPVCLANDRKGKNSYCRYNPCLDATGGPAFVCMKSNGGMDFAAGWKVLDRIVKGTNPPVYEPSLTRNKVGATYVPGNAEVRKPTDAELAAASEKRRKQEAYEQAERDRAIQQAKELWASAGNRLVLGTAPAHGDGKGPQHPRIADYFEARGVPVADMPDQRLPSHVRFYGQTYGTHTPEGSKKKVRFTGPAALFGCLDRDKRIKCVQRVWLDYSGKPAKAGPPTGVPADEWSAKRTIGSTSGVCWFLSNPEVTGVLVLAEGPETSVACWAATHVGVGCVLSTTGLQTLDLPPQLLDAKEGKVRVVVFAADCDGVKKNGARPGQDAAGDAARVLAEKYPHLVVRLAIPRPVDAPTLFEADGEPKDGGCDWLDVYKAAGREAVRAALLENSIVVGKGARRGGGDDGPPDETDLVGPGDHEDWDDHELLGGDGPEIPPGELPQARTLLKNMRLFSPPQERRAGECFRVAHWRGVFYRYVRSESKGCFYREVSDALMRGYVWQRLQRYRIWKKKHLERMNPSRKTAENVRDAMIGEIAVDSSDGTVVLPPKFDDLGRPMWSDRHVEPEPVDAKHLIPVLNGILDVEQLKKKVVLLKPHSPRLFSLSCRPFTVDVGMLREVLDAGADGQDELGKKHWPKWQEVLEHASMGDAGWKERMWRWFGLCLTPITKYQKAAFFLGAPGGSKSTFLWVLGEVVGEESTAAATFGQLGERFGLTPLVGKNLIKIGDAGSSRNSDPGATLEMVKSIIGGDVVPVERKHGDIYKMRLTGKLTVASNDLPKWPDTAGAMARRILPFRFDAILEESRMDRDLESKLVAELPAIFCASLGGLVRLELAGTAQGFQLGDTEREVVETIRDDNEPLFGFVEEDLVRGRNPATGEMHWAWPTDLYKAYKAWAERNSIEHVMTMPALMKKLRAMVSMKRCQASKGDRSKRWYEGVGVRADTQGLMYSPQGPASDAQQAQGGGGSDDAAIDDPDRIPF